MAAAVDLADLGFEAASSSPLTSDQTAIIAAALDAPTLPTDGEPLPLLWHWAHFTPRTPTAAIGPDGHPPTPAHLHDRYPRRMWASGSIEAPGRLIVGEPAERRSEIVERKESDGRTGPLLIVTVEHTYRQGGEVPLIERQTLVYRTQGAPVPTPEGDHVPAVEDGDGRWVERRCPTPVELFRFSAITFNSHRIHYDAAYARDEEGYPGLVVHGPLTALTAATSMERTTGRRLTSFRFRATAPLFVGLPSHLVGTTDGDDVTVEVVRNDGVAAMETSGTLASGDGIVTGPALGTARSYLYVPGDRPERFAKAATSGADAVIIDLEDAVAVAAKDQARADVVSAIGDLADGVEVWVRINQGERGGDDLAALVGTPGLSGVFLPKAAPATVAAALDALGGTPFVALVETATAVLELPELARSPGSVTMAMGEVDLAADLRLEPSPDGREMDPIRLAVVVASAAAGLAPPIGPVWVAVRDVDGLATSTTALRRNGFGARQAIHPDQVGPINEAFTPSPDEVERARATLAGADAAGNGAWVDAEGRMVDEAVLRTARRTVALAERWGI